MTDANWIEATFLQLRACALVNFRDWFVLAWQHRLTSESATWS
jgi:hypothetical protein